MYLGDHLSKKKTILAVNSVKSNSWRLSANDVVLNCLNWPPVGQPCTQAHFTDVVLTFCLWVCHQCHSYPETEFVPRHRRHQDFLREGGSIDGRLLGQIR